MIKGNQALSVTLDDFGVTLERPRSHWHLKDAIERTRGWMTPMEECSLKESLARVLTQDPPAVDTKLCHSIRYDHMKKFSS